MTARQRAIRERLRELELKHGYLSTDIVIAAAKNPKDVLHAEFTWDVKKAAMERWREQARALIRSVKYTERTTDIELAIPNYVHVTIEECGGGYMSVDRVKQEKDLALEVFNDEVKRARAALERVRGIADILKCRQKLEKALEWLIDLQREAA